MGRRIGIYIIIKILMAPLRAWRPPRCPLACCAALRGRVAPAFILRPCRTVATPSPPLPPSSRLSVLAPLLLRRMGRDRPDSSACPLPLPAGALKHIILTKKHLSSVRLVPTTCARFFFLRAAVRLPALLLRRKAGRLRGSVECCWLRLPFR